MLPLVALPFPLPIRDVRGGIPFSALFRHLVRLPAPVFRTFSPSRAE
jgi:hypothetical protein